MISYCRRYWKCFVWAACALAASCGLIWLSRSGTGFAQWYAEYLFPFFPNTIGRLLSPLCLLYTSFLDTIDEGKAPKSAVL